MLKQPLRSPRPRPGEAKRGQIPCRARRHGDLQSDVVVAWVRSMPLPPGTVACHLAINCGLGLLLRNAGGDLRFLAVYVAKADIAISPSWPRSERLAIYLRHRKATWGLPPPVRRRRETKSPTAQRGRFCFEDCAKCNTDTIA